ncbi:hypothetical protein [Naasia aerilata]|uniref:Asp23/Gls24 family envelope stress response protein n=1 Tax=Naasia aerilata TaxID=1162966 RepID=A0ABM8GC10_9MICO|nr:hypothetical protein [Naasia aerilata]BDZ45784.1 hypothetical protein GCM10025866_16930 [Naasia aerilata]
MTSYSTPDDLSYGLTQMLRKLDGVTAVYAMKPVLAKVVSAVVEAVKNEPAGVHLVTVTENEDGVDVAAYIGVTDEAPAPEVCRRAHDAIRDFVAENSDRPAAQVSVKIGRVG